MPYLYNFNCANRKECSKKQSLQKSSLTFSFHNFHWLSKNSNLFISVRHFWTYNNLILQRQYDSICRHGFDYGFYSSKDLTINLLIPFRPNPGRREKIKLNFYFHTSFWCLKRFYEGLKGLCKTFWGTTKKYENKNWI